MFDRFSVRVEGFVELCEGKICLLELCVRVKVFC